MEFGEGYPGQVSPPTDFEQGTITLLFEVVGRGPHDFVVNRVDEKRYLISTVKYPEGYWQTAVLDTTLEFFLEHPVLVLNEFGTAGAAALNHLATVMLVTTERIAVWPKGSLDVHPTSQCWRKHYDYILSDLLCRPEMIDVLIPRYRDVRISCDSRII
jgi:hypothetical protein